MYSYLIQRLIVDFFVIITKLNSELTIPGKTEKHLRIGLDHLSSELYFLILYEIANLENVIKAPQVSFY